MNIAQFAIEKKVVTLTLSIALFIAGVMAFFNLSRLEDPEFTIKDALIITRYPGATPQEVEQQVTDLIETQIQRMPQLKEVVSVSKAGLSTITVSMQDKYDKHTLPEIWQQLRSKIDDIKSDLPPGASEPQILDDYGDVFGIVYALTGDGFSNKELYEYAKLLRKELLLVDDVAKIDLWGVQQEAIYVEFSRNTMNRLQINPQSIAQLFSNQNSVASSGQVKIGEDYVRINSTQGLNAVKDIENLIIPSQSGNGRLIYLKDIATVTREYVTPAQTHMIFNGENAVGLAISNTSGANVITLAENVESRLQEIQKTIPVGLEATAVIKQADAVTRAIDGFLVSLAQAIAIVIVVLLIFMGWRSGLIIGVVLLVTVIATFLLMDWSDVALERISLGALIIALGMLVDNAIVICEAMLVKIQHGEDRMKTAKLVVQQNALPLLGATFIAILAFAAIGLSDDATGEFCRSLFQVMLFSLLTSWVLALTLTPLMCYWLIPAKKQIATEQSGDKQTDDAYSGSLFTAYRKLLTFCVSNRAITCLISIILMASSIYGFSHIKGQFFPKSTMPFLMVHYWLPEGSDIRETKDDVSRLERFIAEQNEVKSVSNFIGQGAPRFILTYAPEITNSSYGFVLIETNSYQEINSLYPKLEQHLAAEFPQAQPKIQRFNLGPSPKNSLEVRFIGPNPQELRKLSEQAKQIFEDAGTIVVRDDWRNPVKTINPQYAENQAQLAGVTRDDLNTALETNFVGQALGLYRENDELIPIVSRATISERQDISEIENVQVWSASANAYIPIGQVVNEFNTEWENAQIHRRDRHQAITAGGEPIDGKLASELFEQVKADIEAIELPEGYSMEWGGEHESSSDAQSALNAGITGSFILMVLISIVLFNSIKKPIVIWLVVPFAIIGVSFGLLGTGTPFGFMSLLGFLSLSGMLIKNAIVLIEQIAIEENDGKPPYRALIDAAISRSRPVLMAAATTVLGMIPLLSDDFFIGMAITIMAGLSFATLLTLILVPVFYSLLFNVRQTAH
ncbi:efflux RND transporter permease subunit [Sessilibacter corallicola]|uniref:efflux RND transporter permease subunit n=1 Tax=Sessilibacter corallicola TaxID=2904075 RepID=UPI001E3A8ABF|nr:efflux RND transporter permease subunit [Sessilibacter corallicola]MCE2028045.1 efflux RND transporter permease subunit [Sessilibacter corallicola]